MSLLHSNYRSDQIDTPSILSSTIDIDNPDNLSNYEMILLTYQYEIEERKKLLTDDDISLQEMDFLSNVINIKNKINHMKKKHKHLLDNAISIKNEINEYEEMKLKYESFSNFYYKINKEYSNESKQKIMEDLNRIINIRQKDLLSIDSTIDSLLTKITTYQNIIKNNDEKILDTICPTCQVETVTFCLNPCGHTFCKDCISRMNVSSLTSKCYICRSSIISAIKLYII